MNNAIIVGFNGAPQSWKSTVCAQTMALLGPGINRHQISFVNYWESALPELMRELNKVFNRNDDYLSYETAKQVSINGVTGRQFLIAGNEAMKTLIPNLSAHYAGTSINNILARQHVEPKSPTVFFLENVGFPEEYQILGLLGLPIIKVYLSDKRMPGRKAYGYGECFDGDSRVCLRTPDSLVDPLANALVGVIEEKLGLTA